MDNELIGMNSNEFGKQQQEEIEYLFSYIKAYIRDRLAELIVSAKYHKCYMEESESLYSNDEEITASITALKYINQNIEDMEKLTIELNKAREKIYYITTVRP